MILTPFSIHAYLRNDSLGYFENCVKKVANEKSSLVLK